MSLPSVDIVVLSRDASALDSRVLSAIRQQQDVDVRLHRVVGTPRECDQNRWATIARARNVGRTLGSSDWLMFVDDDVLLADNTVAQLLAELKEHPTAAALAADYLGQAKRLPPAERGSHVAMGATLFRRDALSRTPFRAEIDKCECQCMVDDMAEQEMRVLYSAHARATHLRTKRVFNKASHESSSVCRPPGVVLTAFDRRHTNLFAGRFLRSLRSAGNDAPVYAVTYGLSEREEARVNRLPGVQSFPQAYTRVPICRARLRGFQTALQILPGDVPVAFWDAGDVLFQRSLAPLWELVRSTPDQLQVVEEVLPWERNPAQQDWTGSIHDDQRRAQAQNLLLGKPVINGGFTAGTAAVLLDHFKRADELGTQQLKGAGGGDQVILNVMRYQEPQRYQTIDQTWNYCLAARGKCVVKAGQFWDSCSRDVVRVVHGNGLSFPSP